MVGSASTADKRSSSGFKTGKGMAALNADPESGIYSKVMQGEREGQLCMHVHAREEARGGKRATPAKACRCGNTHGEVGAYLCTCIHGWKPAGPSQSRASSCPCRKREWGGGDTCGLNHGW